MSTLATERQDQSRASGTDEARLHVRRWVLHLLVGLVWLYVLFGSEGLIRQVERYQQRASLRTALEQQLAEVERVRVEVEQLEHDPVAIERAVRTELDYQRPGEITIFLESPAGATQ